MDHLPGHILTNIFQHITFQSDKIECMLVSRHWKEVMESFILYYTTVLYSPERVTNLLEHIRKYPHVTIKIKELLVVFRDIEASRGDLNILLCILPKLKTVSIPKDWNGNSTTYAPIKYPWRGSIVQVFNEQSDPLISPVLPWNICPNLTELAVSIENTDILASLQNAYNLKSLTLSNGSICPRDLEMIHTKVPYLQALALVSIRLTDGDFDLQNTIPAIFVRKLTLKKINLNYVTLGARPLVYFVRKYPNLVDLDFRIYYVGREISPDTLNDDVWTPMFGHLGPRLKNLFIDYRHEKDDLYQKLDAFGCQLNQLKISPFSLLQGISLAHSQQIHSIQRLELQNVQCIDYTWLNRCVALQELQLSKLSIDRDTNFTDILANTPSTLKSLRIINARLYFDPNGTRPSLITTLGFKDILLSVNMDTFIDQHFPNLSELEVNRWPRNERVLRLPSLNLNVFRFSAYNDSQSAEVLIHTLNNIESRMYYVPLKDYCKLVPERFQVNGSPYQSYLLDTSCTDEPDITLYCRSLKNIYF